MAGRRVAWLITAMFVLAVACAAPTPTATPSAPPSPPAPSLSASPPPTPTVQPTVALTRFSDGGLAFNYPSGWRVIAQNSFGGTDSILVVLGTGDWQFGCVTTSDGGTECGENVLIADPGEVVVEFSTRGHGPAMPVYELPPFRSVVLPFGLAATIDDLATSTLAMLFVPGTHAVNVRVGYGSPPSDAEIGAVHAIIESVEYGTDGRDIDLNTWDDEGADPGQCVRQVVRGQLGRGDFSSVNLLTDATFAFLAWPSGWTARTAADRRLEILDDADELVAREWDELEIGGRGDPNEFRVCPDAVSVIRAFPLAPE